MNPGQGTDAEAMAARIADGMRGVREIESSGDSFFVYDPMGDLPSDRWLPFATIVTGDRHDQVSDLYRPGVFRLNIGLTTATYVARFGPPPTGSDATELLQSRFDYTALDVVMPHPVYAGYHWVCVLNPGEATLRVVDELLAEAYAFAVRKDENRRRREGAAAAGVERAARSPRT
jgi:hypothetical protein